MKGRKRIKEYELRSGRAEHSVMIRHLLMEEVSLKNPLGKVWTFEGFITAGPREKVNIWC